MIIVSQDKKATVNFNKKEEIFLEEDYYEGKFRGVKIIAIGKIYTFLGIYDTEERAKEVLQEIIERYTNWNNLVCGQPTGFCSPKYEMPEK